jgi:peptide/nickel transport system permease protein
MKYLGRRMVHGILLLLGISFLSFALLQLAPGEFFDSMRVNPRISKQTIDGLRVSYGMDKPFPVRYARWLASVAKGQFGVSLAYNSPVAPLLRVRARNTLLLTGVSTFFAWLLAIPIGIFSATKRGKAMDRATGAATSALLTIPDLLLFLGLLLVAVRTGWFPAGGMVSPGLEGVGFWSTARDVARHLVLPALGLMIVALPVLVRHVRSSVIQVLESSYIRAARGHGISGSRLLFRYVLRAAANPLISLLGFSIGTMLSASLLVEVVLSWPGLGPLLVEAILARDVYVVVGAVMLSSVFLVAGNLIADLLLFASDPRIRVEQVE